jgi:hypothetical protein
LNFSEDWFSIDEKPPIAYALLEILEGADLKPSDLNGVVFAQNFAANLS